MENVNFESAEVTENIRVVIRIRPLHASEIKKRYRNIIDINANENGIALLKTGGTKSILKSFKFGKIFGETTSQREVYRQTVSGIVNKVLEGYNGTIFAYGQTGSGKTYTVSGIPKNSDLQGILPNAFDHIFHKISGAKSGTSFVVRATYLEIYNEHIRDLLALEQSSTLEIGERGDVGVYVKGLTGYIVTSVKYLLQLLHRGNANRASHGTSMNSSSSRSHTVFTVMIESKDDNGAKIGKLNFVDLAGSERVGRAKCTGDRLKEAIHINQSLSVLGNVISGLVEKKGGYIPYRNSKLTRLLKDSLGGNSKTLMIATISPSESDFEESLCTLRYVTRVKYVTNYARINMQTQESLIQSFEKQIQGLQKQLASFGDNEEPKVKVKNTIVRQQYCLNLELVETKKMLLDKIAAIQEKILVGEENLLEKAQEQHILLQMSYAEIEDLDQSQQLLEEQLLQEEERRVNIEEKYSNLQEENAEIGRKIKIVQSLLKDAKEIYVENEQAQQKEIEGLLDINRYRLKQLQILSIFVDETVPEMYLRKVEQNMKWNSDTVDYETKSVYHAGNNVPQTPAPPTARPVTRNWKMLEPYFNYSGKQSPDKQVKPTLQVHLPEIEVKL